MRIEVRCEIALYVFDTKKTMLQKDIQIGHPICKSAGQSVVGRLVDWTEHIQAHSSAAKAKTVNPMVAAASETMSLMAVTVNMIDSILILVVIAL